MSSCSGLPNVNDRLILQTSFLSTRNSLASRKCAVDDLAATTQRLCQHHYKKALLFVDNAGSDVVLGKSCGK